MRKLYTETKSKNKGLIMITMLIVMSFATSLIVALSLSVSRSVDSIQSLQTDYQSTAYIVSYVDTLSFLFDLDTNKYDSVTDIWNEVPVLLLPSGALLTTEIVPLNARMNLNNLFYGGSRGDSFYETAIPNLMSSEGLDRSIYYDLLSWGDPQNKPSFANEKFYRSSGKNFTSLYQANLIPSARKSYKNLSKIFQVADTSEKININFASAKLLKQAIPELESYADRIALAAKTEPFEDISKITSRGYIPADVFAGISKYITTVSNYYEVILTLTQSNGINTYYHVLVQKESSNVKILKFIEGDDERYF